MSTGSISVRNATVIIPPDKTILCCASADFPPAATTVILGPSGSGKSTLLKTAAFLRPPDRGDILYEGKSVASMSEEEMKTFRRRTGFMFQDGALWANQTVFENLALPVRYHFPAYSNKDVQDHVMAVVERLGFTGDLSVRPSAYSAGRQKIISFIRAVVTDPDMLFIDEPSTFVDWRSMERLNIWFNEFKREHRTLVVVTHEASLADSLADRLVVLDEGKITAEGPIDDVLGSEDPVVAAETKTLRAMRASP